MSGTFVAPLPIPVTMYRRRTGRNPDTRLIRAMEAPTTRREMKISLRVPTRTDSCPLTRTESRYPRKLAVLMNPIWE
jgi:hypothetical protein